MDIKKKRLLKVLIISLTIVVIAVTTVVCLALSNVSYDKASLVSTDHCLKKVVAGAILDRPTNLSVPEINSLVIDSIGKEIYVVSIDKDAECPLTVCVPVEYKGFHTSFSFNAAVRLVRETLELHLSNTKIGRLPMPPKFFLGKLKERLPDTIDVSGDTISFPALLSFDFNQKKINVQIVDLTLDDNSITLKTKGVLDSVVSLVKDELKSILGNLL